MDNAQLRYPLNQEKPQDWIALRWTDARVPCLMKPDDRTCRYAAENHRPSAWSGHRCIFTPYDLATFFGNGPMGLNLGRFSMHATVAKKRNALAQLQAGNLAADPGFCKSFAVKFLETQIEADDLVAARASDASLAPSAEDLARILESNEIGLQFTREELLYFPEWDDQDDGAYYWAHQGRGDEHVDLAWSWIERVDKADPWTSRQMCIGLRHVCRTRDQNYREKIAELVQAGRVNVVPPREKHITLAILLSPTGRLRASGAGSESEQIDRGAATTPQRANEAEKTSAATRSGIVEEKRPVDERFVFRLRGVAWEIRFDGEEASLHNMLGLAYIRSLLERPGSHIPSADLVVRPGDAATRSVSAGESFDAKLHPSSVVKAPGEVEEALQHTKRELDRIAAEKEEARAGEHWDEFKKLEEQEKEILDYTKRSYTPDGREKGLSSPNQRVHGTVKKAISDAKAAIEKAGKVKLLKFLRAHVRAASGFCHIYQPPDPPISWVLA